LAQFWRNSIHVWSGPVNFNVSTNGDMRVENQRTFWTLRLDAAAGLRRRDFAFSSEAGFQSIGGKGLGTPIISAKKRL
jgi:hypothetical protein